MSRWERLDAACVPGGAELVLYGRHGDFVIRADGWELMTSRGHGSEEELARLACGPLAHRACPRVLVGGLGMGFTLRAALDHLPADGGVRVSELVPAVVEWNRRWLGSLAGFPLGDPRVRVRCEDVTHALHVSEPYDAILLDVDNGPAPLTQTDNSALYDDVGLARLRDALVPGGRLGVWSADTDVSFLQRLRATGFRVSEHHVPALSSGGGPLHVLWIAQAPRT